VAIEVTLFSASVVVSVLLFHYLLVYLLPLADNYFTMIRLPTVIGKRNSLPTVIGKRISLPTVIGKRISLPTVIGKRISLPTVIGKRHPRVNFHD